MSQQLNPYLTFNGNCAEAMDFYATALKGTAKITTFREFGMDDDGVMHSQLDTPTGFHLYAADHVEGMGEYRYGTNVQCSLFGTDREDLKGYWDALSEGATVVVPLEKQMWGDEYGQLVDKFGIVWHLNMAPADEA